VCFGTSRLACPIGDVTEKKRKEKRKKGEKDIQGDWLHAAGSSMLVVSCALKRVVGCTLKSWKEHGWVMHAM